jgi:putative ABC transport system permease protein
MTVVPEMRTAYGSRYLRVIGRLRDGVSVDAARQEMDAIGRGLIETMPATHEASVVLAPIQDELAGDAPQQALLFLAATVLVLLLVSVNVANLMLARINHRRTEFAIRTALGAGRGRLISHVLGEGLVLGIVGGAAGLLCAWLGIALVMAYGPGHLPGIESTALDARAALVAIVLATATGLLCGAVPALRLARARLSGLLGSTRASTGLEVSRKRTLIVAAEVALAVPLLVGAALLMRTLLTLQQVDPGFDPSHAMQFRVSLPQASYENRDARIAFFHELTAALSALPGVTAAGAASSLPLGGLNNTGGSIVYERADGSLAETGVGTRAITSGYVPALGVPLRQGRLLTDGPEDESSVVINARAAESLWPGMNAIARRLRPGQLADEGEPARWLTVVGVVGDMRHEALGRLPNAEIFQSHRGNAWSTMSVVVRTDGDPATLSAPIRRVVRERDPLLPVVGLGPVSQFIDGQLSRPRFGAFCATLFGLLGLVLAGAGTFAVLSLVVAQRVKEIGIRMAFGASPRSVGTLVITQSMAPAIAGAGAGLFLTIWLIRAIESVLYGVAPQDPLMLGGSVAVVLGVALLAAALPTIRAMRTDPIAALRAD